MITLLPVPGLPAVMPGDDLAVLIAARMPGLQDGDVLVVAQKIVSKAEDRYIVLTAVTPSAAAIALAAETGKDPHLVEAILSESVRVVRQRPGLLITEHRLGFVMANAGVDQSNLPQDGTARVLLLPADPDASAGRLRDDLRTRTGADIAVIVSDSFGRPWRRGTVGVAIGAAGLPSLVDLRGQQDLFGRRLEVTEIGFADEIASAASLLMGQADEGCPAVVVRGLGWRAPAAPAAALVRTAGEDLFR